MKKYKGTSVFQEFPGFLGSTLNQILNSKKKVSYSVRRCCFFFFKHSFCQIKDMKQIQANQSLLV